MLRSWCIRPYCADPFWFHLAGQSAILHSSVHRKCAMFWGLVAVDIHWPWIHGINVTVHCVWLPRSSPFSNFCIRSLLAACFEWSSNKNLCYPRYYSRQIFKMIPNTCQTWIDLWGSGHRSLDFPSRSAGKTDLREFDENVEIFNVFLQLRLRSQERLEGPIVEGIRSMHGICGGHLKSKCNPDDPRMYNMFEGLESSGESFCVCTFHQQNGNF